MKSLSIAYLISFFCFGFVLNTKVCGQEGSTRTISKHLSLMLGDLSYRASDTIRTGSFHSFDFSLAYPITSADATQISALLGFAYSPFKVDVRNRTRQGLRLEIPVGAEILFHSQSMVTKYFKVLGSYATNKETARGSNVNALIEIGLQFKDQQRKASGGLFIRFGYPLPRNSQAETKFSTVALGVLLKTS